MKLLSLEVEGFGLFSKRRTFSFAEDGLNVVFGPNESGKSTLMNAIVGIIFGSAKKEEESSYESWEPSGSFRGAVELKSGSAAVRFSRDFTTNEVLVTRKDGARTREVFRGDAGVRSRSEERREYVALLQDMFGLSDGELAYKTAFIGQLDVETELTPELRALISGAGPSDFQKAIETLEGRFESITVENPWGRRARLKKRAIETAEDALRQARENLGAAESFLNSSVFLKTETGELEKEKLALRDRRDKAKSFLEKLSQLFTLQQSLKQAEKRLDIETKASLAQEKVQDSLKRARKTLAEDFGLFAGVRADLSPLLARAVALEEQLLADQGRLAAVSAAELSARQRAAGPGLSPWAIALVSAASLVVLLLAGFLLGKPLVLGLVGLGVSVGLAVLLFLYQRLSGRPASGAATEVAQAEELSKNIARIEGEEHSVVDGILASFPDGDREAARELGVRTLSAEYGKFKDARQRLKELEGSLTVQETEAGETGLSKALNEVAEVKLQVQKFVSEVPELSPLKEEPEKAVTVASNARDEIESSEERIEVIEKELREKQMSYSRLSATQILPPEVYEEEIDRLEQTLSKLRLRKDALKLAVDTLRECVSDYQAHSMDRISERVTDLFSSITGGRYKSVRLPKDLESEDSEPVLETSSDFEVSPSLLSTGASDQLYFCMRLAMTEELTGEKGLPLILDDPFVNFDEERLERARELLHALSTKRGLQVILFTHGERHLEWGGHVIRLG